MLCADARNWKPDKSVAENPYTSCLGNEALFALYIAAIGHDVGHPGFTNAFMKNAKTPLSLVYDNKSALEQMHYALLLSIMRYHGLGTLLDRPQTGPSFRKLLYKTLLATDMSVHCDFMEAFQSMGTGEEAESNKRQVLVCQALIKCADISNPGRPHQVSKKWAAALMDEWTRQANLERHLHLPPSVNPSDDPLAEARSQVFFIGNFTKPLFSLVATSIPQMQQYADRCQDNLDLWNRRTAELLKKEPSSKPVNGTAPPECYGTEDFITAFPLTLPTTLLTEEPQSDPDNQSSCGSCSSPSVSGKRLEDPAPNQKISPISSPPSPPSSILPSSLSSIQRPETAMSISSQSTKSIVSALSESASSIRAAYKASVRKKKSFHRTSWNPGPVSTPANFPLGGHQLKSNIMMASTPVVGSPSTPLAHGYNPPLPALASATSS